MHGEDTILFRNGLDIGDNAASRLEFLGIPSSSDISLAIWPHDLGLPLYRVVNRTCCVENMESSDQDNITASRTKEFSRAATGVFGSGDSTWRRPGGQGMPVQSEKKVCDELPSKNA